MSLSEQLAGIYFFQIVNCAMAFVIIVGMFFIYRQCRKIRLETEIIFEHCKHHSLSVSRTNKLLAGDSLPLVLHGVDNSDDWRRDQRS